jgi:hypothetical protein
MYITKIVCFVDTFHRGSRGRRRGGWKETFATCVYLDVAQSTIANINISAEDRWSLTFACHKKKCNNNDLLLSYWRQSTAKLLRSSNIRSVKEWVSTTSPCLFLLILFCRVKYSEIYFELSFHLNRVEGYKCFLCLNMHTHIYACIARELRRTSSLCLSAGCVVEKKSKNNCALVCVLESNTTATIHNDDDENICDRNIEARRCE